MNSLFTSRARRTAFAACYTESVTTHIRNFLLLFLCISDYYTVCGQQVLWLYVPQQPNFFHDQKSGSGINEIIQHNGVNSDSRAAVRNVMAIVPLASQSMEPKFHRSSYGSPNIPYSSARKYGYESAMKIGREWYEPFYTSRVYEDSSAETENIFLKHDTFALPKSTIMGIGSNDVDEDLDSGSNESGSTEIHSTATSVEEISVALRQRCTLEGNQARYHPETGGCYTVGTKGPCGKHMIFTTNDDFNGHCECDQGSIDRPLVQIGEKCHFLYTQAICPPGYWLTLQTSITDPECQPNPCYQQPIAEKYLYHHHTKKAESFPKLVTSIKTDLVLFKGECVRLNSSSRHCGREGEVVLFPEGRTEPACGFPKSTRRIYRRQISSVPRFRCGPGKVLHQPTNRCIARSSRRIMRFVGVGRTVRRRSVR